MTTKNKNTAKETSKDLVRSNVNKGVRSEKEKRSGVIQTMINLLSKKEYSKDTLLSAMMKKFPERDGSALMSTIRAQFSGKLNITRLERERGLELSKTFKNVKGTEVTFYQITSFDKDWSLEEEAED